MEPGKAYHIYTHANGFENLFKSSENYRYFLRRYAFFINPVAHTLAWCLMPNHIHLLIQIKSEQELTEYFMLKHAEKEVPDVKTLQGFKTLEAFTIRQFGHLFNSYTQAFNKMYQRKGSLFMHSFKRKEIASDGYFTNIIFYIHTNAIKHGFVKEIKDWPWSSYHEIISETASSIQQQEVIQWFGNREEFIRFHHQPQDKEMPEIDF